MQDYDAAIKSFVTSVSEHPAVCAIYQVGSVSAPGISDIDLIVVIEDDFSDQGRHDLSRLASQASHPYLFRHSPLYLNISLLRQTHRFCNIDSPRLHWGTAFEIETPDAEELRQIKTIVSAEALAWTWSGCIRPMQSHASKTDVRTILGYARQVEHSIGMCSGLLSNIPENGDRFVREAEYLRREWFHLPEQKYALLDALLLDAKAIVESLLCQFVEFVTHRHGLCNVEGERGAYLGHPYDLLFVRDWQARQHWFDRLYRERSRTGRAVCCLPLEFLAFYEQYSCGSGAICGYIGKHLLGICSYHLSDQLRSRIAERMDLTHRHLAFVRTLGGVRMLYPPAYHGFSPPLRLRSILGSWLRPWASRRRGIRLLRTIAQG